MVLISSHLPKTIHANLNYLSQKITIHLEENTRLKKEMPAAGYLELHTFLRLTFLICKAGMEALRAVIKGNMNLCLLRAFNCQVFF